MPELAEDIIARVAFRLARVPFFVRVLVYALLFTVAAEFVAPVLHANVCDGLDATDDTCITRTMGR